MARNAQARFLRSPSDLTAQGAGPANTTTVAGLGNIGASGILFKPNARQTNNANPPTVGTASTGDGWRDAASENTVDTITYAAGTWTVQTRHRKTAQIVVVDEIIRITSIVYRVSSTGVFVSEIGRAVSPDTTIQSADITISGNFTTGSATLFAISDKIQVEIYVENIVAGLPAAATAYDITMLVNETGAAANVTGPTYTIQLVRTDADAFTAAQAVVRSFTGARSLTDAATAAQAVARIFVGLRVVTDNSTLADSVLRIFTGLRILSDAITDTQAAVRSFTGARSITDAIFAPDSVIRTLLLPRVTSDSSSNAQSVLRILAAVRNGTDATTAAQVVVRLFIGIRSIIDATTAADATIRTVNYGRFADDAISGLSDIIRNPTRTLAGIVYDNVGVIVPNATVKLVRQLDDRVVRTTTSAADGSYSFARDSFDNAQYYVISYINPPAGTRGISDRNLVPV